MPPAESNCSLPSSHTNCSFVATTDAVLQMDKFNGSSMHSNSRTASSFQLQVSVASNICTPPLADKIPL